jgi:hypothetical protein
MTGSDVRYEDPHGELTLNTVIENRFPLTMRGNMLRAETVLSIDGFLPDNKLWVRTPFGVATVDRSMIRAVGMADRFPR